MATGKSQIKYPQTMSRDADVACKARLNFIFWSCDVWSHSHPPSINYLARRCLGARLPLALSPDPGETAISPGSP